VDVFLPEGMAPDAIIKKDNPLRGLSTTGEEGMGDMQRKPLPGLPPRSKAPTQKLHKDLDCVPRAISMS